MNNLRVFQQCYFVDDLIDVIELVLPLVERDDYATYDFLDVRMDHVHQYTILKRKRFRFKN